MSRPAPAADPALLTGYVSRPSYLPGELVEAHISSDADVEVTLVRLGESASSDDVLGERIDALREPIPAPGRRGFSPGSFVVLEVPPAVVPRVHGSVFGLWVHPTAAIDESRTLVQFCNSHDVLLGVALTREGTVTVTTPERQQSTAVAVPERVWSLLLVSLAEERPTVSAHRAGPAGSVLSSSARLQAPLPDAPQVSRIRIGADVASGGAPRARFDGKVEAPAFWEPAAVHDDAIAARIAAVASGRGADPAGAVVRWDFALGIATAEICRADAEADGAAGRCVNAPTRAVTGHLWDGTETAWTHAPEQYGAIHLHSDDIDDAAWPVALRYRLPPALRSGVYALELCSEHGRDWLVFAVRAQHPAPTAVRVLLPTFTYLAYADEPVFAPHVPLTRDARDDYTAAHGLLSLYNEHRDGSGVCLTSWRRPNLNLRPDYVYWLTGTRHGLSADLLLIAWLERRGIDYVVLTDHDLHAQGPVALGATPALVLTGGHPEYWSGTMMAAVENWLDHGGRLAYLGGNGMDAVVATAPDRPHLLELRRRSSGNGLWESPPGEAHLASTGEPGGPWRHRRPNLATVAGAVYAVMGFGRGRGYRRTEMSHDPRAAFLFEGLDGDRFGTAGTILGAAAGYECDVADTNAGTPPHALVVARSELLGEGYEPQGNRDERYAEAVFFETRAGGAVFSVGSIAWIGSLNVDRGVSRVTENAVRRLSDPEPFPTRHIS